MSKVIVITSGKGGVGKTTTSANVAAGLALRGKKSVAIDFDVGLRNLDLVMGCERRVVYDFVNVIKNEAKLAQALIKDKRLEAELVAISGAYLTADDIPEARRGRPAQIHFEGGECRIAAL